MQTISNRPVSMLRLWIPAAILYSLSGSLRAEQEVWMIDMHGVSWTRASEENFERISYRRLVNGRWERAEAQTFYDTQDPSVPLIVFSPGYTATTTTTVEVGLGIKRLCDARKPARFVFWNWPAERIDLDLVRDIRAKIPVAAASGIYMSLFLQRLHPESKVCLIGFSFGTRVLCDAVEKFGDARPETMRLHLVLSGAATDQGGLAQGARHGNIPRLCDRILVLYNPEDFRLQFYPFLYGKHHRTEALGYLGPPMRRIAPEYRQRIEAINLAPYIGVRHKTMIHLQTPVFRKRIGEYLFFGG